MLLSLSAGTNSCLFCSPNQLPRFFNRSHCFHIYDKDIVFEDHIRGLVTRGIQPYMINFALLKMRGSLMYGSVRMNILKMTKHPEDGTVRVRWQVVGVSGWRLILTFWRYVPFRLPFSQKDESRPQEFSDTTDGFSIFYLNSQGLVYKHVCDKMMPDSSGAPDLKNGIKTLPV